MIGFKTWMLAELRASQPDILLKVITVNVAKNKQRMTNDGRRDDMQKKLFPTNRLFVTHKLHTAINTVIYTIGQIRQLNLKGSVVCERMEAVGLEGVLLGSVWAGKHLFSRHMTSVPSTLLSAAVMSSSQSLGCALSAPWSWLIFTHDTGHLGGTPVWCWPQTFWLTQLPSCLLVPCGI